MAQALTKAKQAADQGEVPVGAIIVDRTTKEILAITANKCEQDHDPSAHAEVLAIREACRIKQSPRLFDCDMYVTLEPCAMCAAAISFARIKNLYFGAYDPKGGGVEHGGRFYDQPTCHHAPDVYGGINERECGDLLRDFFQTLRKRD